MDLLKLSNENFIVINEDKTLPEAMCELITGGLEKGDNFDPDIITKKLGIKPTTSFKKDEEWRKHDRTGETIYRKFSSWVYRTEYVKTYEPEKLLDEIIYTFSPLINELNELQKELNITFQIGIVLKIFGENSPGLHLRTDQIAFINSINADIDVDMYCYSTENNVKEYLPKKQH
jgi:hypothetical protein